MRFSYRVVLPLIVLALAGLTMPMSAQKIDDAARRKNREQLEGVLSASGPASNMTFTGARTNPNNFVANLTTGLRWSENIEVIFFVTDSDTIVLRGYPKRKGQFINIDKAKDPQLLMRKLLNLGVRTFFHWGVDEDGDAYFGYSFTLESGFPAEAIRIVLRSVANHDQYVGELVTAIE